MSRNESVSVKTIHQNDKMPTAVSTAQHFEGQWGALDGRYIEIYDHGKKVDRGRVDAVTRDGLILWLEQDGVRLRRMFELLPGRTIVLMTGLVSCRDRNT